MGARAAASRPRDLAARVGLTADEVDAAYARSSGAGSRPRTCTRPRCSFDAARTDVCGIAGIVRADPAARGRARRRCSGWRRRSATAAPTASASRSIRAPGSSRRGSRSSICPAAGSRSSRRRGRRCSSTTARSTTTSSCAKELARRRASGSRQRATPRSSCACSSATASPRLERFNGQFAFAWWQPERRRLTLVRDRFGVRPLLLGAARRRQLVFGSEAKALFASGEVGAEPRPRRDRRGLHALGRRGRRGRAFAGVEQLAPGRLLVWERGRIVERRRWWEPAYRTSGARPRTSASCSRQRPPAAAGRRPGRRLPLRRPRLEPDQRARPAREATASCGPSRSPSTIPRYDERRHQRAGRPRARDAATTWSRSAPAEIADALPDVVRHTETPLVRTAPVPLYLLAARGRAPTASRSSITGEGADELFWGYDLFKEVAIRELSQREPGAGAARCSRELYPYLGAGGARRGPALAAASCSRRGPATIRSPRI